MKEYDLIVIGGGAAGLVVAIAGATLGKKTLLVEKHKLGGDCTHYGCIPSKTLLHHAHFSKQLERANKNGLIKKTSGPSWSKVRKYIQETIKEIYSHETPEELKKKGVDVITQAASFINEHSIKAGKQTYVGKRIVIATGGKPRIPSFPEDENVTYETNETIFSIKKLPKVLAIIGAGPIGCEIGQAFARLGSEVHIIDRGELLSREEKDARALLKTALLEDGVHLHLNTEIQSVKKNKVTTTITLPETSIAANAVMAAMGRTPNTQGLDLEKAGVEVDDRGRIITNEHLKTSQPHIYAAGDCTATYQFTHVAEEHARVIINNAILPIISKKFSAKYIPWVTFTDPEIAHVGQTAPQLIGQRYETLEWTFEENDRARTEQDTTGYVRIYITPLRGKILGATIVGSQAGELLATICLAMERGLSARHLSNTLMAYPTRAQSIRWAADKYFRDIIANKLQDVIK